MGFFETLAGAAAIGGVSTMAGGVVGNLINQNQQENEATRNQSNFNVQMDNTIQRKVEDAKRAGLHPLYALGANSSPSSQPITFQDQLGPAISQGGQNLGSAISRMQTGDEKLLAAAQLNVLESQANRDDAQAAYYNSEAMRNMQSGQTGLGVQPEVQGFLGPEGQAPNPPGTAMVERKAAPITSQMKDRQDLIAGRTRGGFELRTMGNNFPMIMPVAEGESPMELWSEMSMYDKAGLINRNMGQFGPQWLDDFWDVMYGGGQAKGKYNTDDMSIKKHKSYLDYKLSPKINQLLYGDEKKYQKREGGSIDPKTGRLNY